MGRKVASPWTCADRRPQNISRILVNQVDGLTVPRPYENGHSRTRASRLRYVVTPVPPGALSTRSKPATHDARTAHEDP
jgi:hypothetical protein